MGESIYLNEYINGILMGRSLESIIVWVKRRLVSDPTILQSLVRALRERLKELSKLDSAPLEERERRERCKIAYGVILKTIASTLINKYEIQKLSNSSNALIRAVVERWVQHLSLDVDNENTLNRIRQVTKYNSRSSISRRCMVALINFRFRLPTEHTERDLINVIILDERRCDTYLKKRKNRQYKSYPNIRQRKTRL